MIPNIFVLNNSGLVDRPLMSQVPFYWFRDVLIEKHFAGAVKRQVCELFWEQVSKYPHQREVRPIISTPHYHLLHIRRNGLFFLSALKQEVSPLLIFEACAEWSSPKSSNSKISFFLVLWQTLHEIVDAFLLYFKSKLNEQIIREHFSLIYQVCENFC